MTSDDDSLQAFAAKYKAKQSRPCSACSLPEAEALNRGKKSGLTLRILKDWLIEDKGYTKVRVAELSAQLQKHFERGHHERV